MAQVGVPFGDVAPPSPIPRASARYNLPGLTQPYPVPAGQPLGALGAATQPVSVTTVNVQDVKRGKGFGYFFVWFIIIFVIFLILILLFRPATFYVPSPTGGAPVPNWGTILLWSVIVGLIGGAIAYAIGGRSV